MQYRKKEKDGIREKERGKKSIWERRRKKVLKKGKEKNYLIKK